MSEELAECCRCVSYHSQTTLTINVIQTPAAAAAAAAGTAGTGDAAVNNEDECSLSGYAG